METPFLEMCLSCVDTLPGFPVKENKWGAMNCDDIVTQPNNLPPWRRRPSLCCRNRKDRFGGDIVLWTLFVILLVLWLLGVVSSYTLGGFIHLLLVLALVVLIFQLISGRRGVV